MPVLTKMERAVLHALIMRKGEFPGNNDKNDLLEAVNAGDAWMNANFGQFTASLPVAFRAGSTAKQRWKLFTDLALAHSKGG